MSGRMERRDTPIRHPSNTRPVRFGLVGTGGFAAWALTPALRAAKDVEFAAVLSRDLAKARSFAAREGAREGFSSREEFFSAVDAVHVATPDPTHEELVLAAAAAGKHVLCEKPLATSVAAARRMRDACARAGVKLGVAYHCRHHPAHRKLFQWIAADELGSIERVRLRFQLQMKDATNWRASPPNPWWAMASIGTHLVDLAVAIVRDEVEDVFARFSSPVFGAANEECASVSLKFRRGAVAELDAFTTLKWLPSRLEVFGKKSAVATDGTVGPRGGHMMRDGWSVGFPDGCPYQGEIEDFAAAILEDREPAANGDVGVANVAVLEAAKLSASSGRSVKPEL